MRPKFIRIALAALITELTPTILCAEAEAAHYTLVRPPADVSEAIIRDGNVRDRVLAAIAGATEIKLVEHTDRTDEAYTGATLYKEEIHREAILSSDQVRTFRTALPVVVAHDGALCSGAIFEPHHRLEIRDQKKACTSIEFSFYGDVALSINGQYIGMLPDHWYSPLGDLVRSAGMDPAFRVRKCYIESGPGPLTRGKPEKGSGCGY